MVLGEACRAPCQARPRAIERRVTLSRDRRIITRKRNKLTIVAAAVATVATLSAPAAATMVSLFRFRVMIRRSRDKVTLRSIARGRARHGARRASPRTTRRYLTERRAVARGRGAGQGAGRLIAAIHGQSADEDSPCPMFEPGTG